MNREELNELVAKTFEGQSEIFQQFASDFLADHLGDFDQLSEAEQQELLQQAKNRAENVEGIWNEAHQ